MARPRIPFTTLPSSSTLSKKPPPATHFQTSSSMTSKTTSLVKKTKFINEISQIH